MACIGCGLGVNADGKGRVDVDTRGGLECNGTAGGTSNTSGRGLSIKEDPADGNAVQLSTAGLYIPPVGRIETYQVAVHGANITGPNNGTSLGSNDAVITLANTTSFAKKYQWQVSCLWGTNDADPGIWAEVAVRVGNGDWIVPGAISLAAGTVVSPIIGQPFSVTVPANTTTTLRGRLRLYRGTMSSYGVTLIAIGGYAA